MPGHNLIVGADNSHHGLFHLLLGESQRVEQASVGSLLHSGFYVITLHFDFLPFFYRLRNKTYSLFSYALVIF